MAFSLPLIDIPIRGVNQYWKPTIKQNHGKTLEKKSKSNLKASRKNDTLKTKSRNL